MATGAGVIKLANFEYPTAETPQDFEDLLNFGRKSWLIDVFGYQFEFATIDEWERRELYKRGANLDPTTRIALMKVDYLTQSIMRAKKVATEVVFNFEHESEKVLLRTILLKSDPKTIGVLWDGYTMGDDIAKKEFEEQIVDIRKRISDGFFVQTGESSEPPVSRTRSPVLHDGS